MDIDTTDPSLVEPSSTSDNADIFPLPFRVLVLVCFGVACFASNMDLLKRVGVHPATLLSAPGDHRGVSSRRIYRVAAVLFGVTLFSWVAYVIIRSELVINIAYALVLAVMVNPFKIVSQQERFRFFKALKRVVFDGIWSEVSLADVILADILTSFAKVLADLYATSCHLIFFGDLPALDGNIKPNSLMSEEVRESCYYDYVGPVITALPYAWRLRQCVSEYVMSDDAKTKRRHIANAVKYASAFPVIFLSAMQHHRNTHWYPKGSVSATGPDTIPDNWQMFQGSSLVILWFFTCYSIDDHLFANRLIFVAINSGYSFYWDVVVDWQLAEHVDPVAGALGFKASSGQGRSRPRSRSDLSDLSNASSPTSSDADSPQFMASSTSSLRNPLLGCNAGVISTRIPQGEGRAQDVSPVDRLPMPPPSFARERATSMPVLASSSHARLLRPRLHFRDPGIYYAAIVLDFLLRFTWSLKLSTHLRLDEFTMGGFVIECLEIIRRWVWVFFRLEREWVAQGYGIIGSFFSMEQGETEAPSRTRSSSQPILGDRR